MFIYLAMPMQQLVQSTTYWSRVLTTSCNIRSDPGSFIDLNEKTIKLLVILGAKILYRDK